MKTNYVIGETYYDKGKPYTLTEITNDKDYPLSVRSKSGFVNCFTLDGRYYTSHEPSLSTSPTEFIAPKSTEYIYNDLANEAMERIIKAHGMTEPMLFNCKPIKSCAENKKEIKIEKAIALLKSEGYTITKKY